MAQLPNIIEKKRSIWRVFWYAIKYSYKSAPLSFVFLCIFTAVLATIGFLNSYNFGQILTILSKPGASFIMILIPLFFVLLFDYLPGPLGFIRASFREHNQRAMKRGFEQDYIQKQADLDIATIEQPEYQDMVYQVRSRGESSMFDIVGWFFTLFNDVLRIFIAFGIIFNFTKIGLIVIIISSVPVYFYEAWRGNNLAKLWTERSEFNRKASTKISPFLGKSSVLEIKFFDAIYFFKEKILVLRKDFDKLFTQDNIKTSPLYAISSIFSSIASLTS
jgi:ABC-type multidrug transport system fused ATPase/permease subunit